MVNPLGQELVKAKQDDIDASVARAHVARRANRGSGRARTSGISRPGASAVRITFGIVWLIDASLKWLPGFRSSFVDTIREAADGQPAWLHGWFSFWIHVIAPRATVFAMLVAVTETGIALSLIVGFARKSTYFLAIGFTLMIWAIAEGFGGPYVTGASDVGTAIIYAVVFVALLVIDAHAESSRYTVDAWLGQRWPGWHRVAEVGGSPVDGWGSRRADHEVVAMMEGDSVA